MAFSIFTKKDDPPAKRPAPARAQSVAPKKPDTPAAPTSRAQVTGQLSQKIDQIQAEMEEFTLDFTTPPSSAPPPAARPQPPDIQAASDVTPTRQLPPDVFDAVLRDLAPAAVTAAVSTAVPLAVSTAVPTEVPTAVPAAPAKKPLIEHGFNPAAKSAAKPVAKSTAKALVPPVAAPVPAAAPVASEAPAVPQANSPAAPRAPAAPAAVVNAAPLLTTAPPLHPAPLKPLPVPGVASVMMMEVEQSPFEAAPVLEQAATLYASGQDLDALAALSAALQNARMPAAPARHAYFLLFDLLENLGRRDEFDAAALNFAVRFETSPPAFNDRSNVKDPMLATGGGQYFALTGVLDSSAAQQFAGLAKTAEKSKVLRIEFGKIGAVTQSGATLLLSHLQAFKKSGHDLVFSSADHLIKLLGSSIETGRRSDPQVFWMLLLEMYQFQQMQAAFEETALNYCITYEVSPPSWVEPVKAASSTPPVNGPATLDVPQDAFYLKGELAGPADAVFKALAAHAGGKARVVIDMFSVKRMDRVAAAAFLNMTQTLHSVKKEIEIRAASPLLAALLVSMGVLNHARFTLRGR